MTEWRTTVAKRRGSREGSIYKREVDARWVGSLHVGYESGKRRRKVFYGKTRREVAQKLNKAVRDQAEGLPTSDDRLTVAAFLRRWLDESAVHTLRPRTLASYRAIVENTLIPALGRVPLSKLQPADVQAYVNELAKRGLSPYTVRNHRAVLRRALSDALKLGLVVRNVAQLVTLPRLPTEEVEPLSTDEARRFLDTVRGSRDEMLYRVALGLGMRQGELLGLSWNAVDFEAQTITVRRPVPLQRRVPPRRAQDPEVAPGDRGSCRPDGGAPPAPHPPA